MGKIVKLTESDLIGIIKRIISEQTPPSTAFVGGQKAGQQVQGAVKGAVKSVATGIQNATLQTIQIGKTLIKGYLVANFMVFIIAGQAFKLQVDFGKKVLSFLASLAKQTGGIVISGANSVANFTQTILNSAATNVASFFTSLFNVIKGLGTKAWAASLSLASKVADIWKFIGSWGANALKSAYGAVTGAAKKVTGAVTGAAKKVASGIGSAWDTAQGFTSGLLGEGVLEIMLEDYNYYNSLPLRKMLNEIHLDTRFII